MRVGWREGQDGMRVGWREGQERWWEVNPTGSTEEGMVGPMVSTYLRELISRMTEVLALTGCSVDDGASIFILV